MTAIFIVYEYFQPSRSDRVHKNVEQAFASRRRAEEWIESWKERNRLDGFESLYSYEIEEIPFDSAA